MSAAQHLEWLSLVEKTGPFLAVGVLDDAFPQGLEKVDTRRRQRIRSAYDEWRDAVDTHDPQLSELHYEWIKLVLSELLEYEPEVLKSGADIAPFRYREPLSGSEVIPDFVVLSGDKARIFINSFPSDTDLSAPLKDRTWSASPVERMISLCRALNVRVGLVTNGEEWSLVSVPADGSSSIGTWFGRIWQQEPVTLQALVSLLGVRRCFGPEDQTVDALLLRSLEHQHEVTDTLGEQVRRAVEVLVQALDRADIDRNRELLRGVSETELYESGLTVMMRLVVLLCAEERKLLLLGEPVYEEYYAVSTLRSRLYEDKEHFGEDVLERRHDAWSRLLAVFRAVFGGIEHETLRLSPLGGSLFDPDRFPFLEGRLAGTTWRETLAVPLPIDNRTVLMLLTALEVLEQRGGAQLLSYEALDVEQIGHVYEGLLERTVKRAQETTLGLIGSRKVINPLLPLAELEKLRTEGQSKLLPALVEQTGRSESAIKNALAKPVDEPSYQRILLACSSDALLANRVKPFVHLLQTDSWGDLLVYREKAFIVTMGAGRRETGTHYTPKSLTEPIVQHTLEPLVYVGPAEGQPPDKWEPKSASEILALKVCDMAMGSGAFLVQTCRWLGDRLVEAWDASEKSGKAVTIDGQVLEMAGDGELLPLDKGERVLIARRLIASRCLYGVDKNPMAVELAKVSLWLVTMMKGRPFNFLDHALKCGDSLLGINSVQQIENFSLRPGERQATFATANLFRYIEEADRKRRELENLPSNEHTQIATKNRLHAEAEAATAKVKAIADCLIALELRGLGGDAYEEQRAEEAENVQLLMRRDADASLNSQAPTINQLSTHAREQLRGRRTFHWAVEFPEVFARCGFDAFVSNPPFVGNKYWQQRLPSGFSGWVEVLLNQKAGKADVVAVFLRRAFELLSKNGTAGMIATSTAREGDTLELGVVHLAKHGTIYRAVSAREWPGDAGVHVCVVWFSKLPSQFIPNLDGRVVTAIGPSLVEASPHEEIHELLSAPWGFIGCDNGGGEILTLRRGDVWLEKLEAAQSPFLRPYISGEDIAEGSHLSPKRWVVDCGDLPLSNVEEKCSVTRDFLRGVVEPARSPEDFKTHPGLIDRWWQMWNPRATQYRKLRLHASCLAIPVVAKFVSVVELPTAFTFTNKICVLEKPAPEQHLVLLSSFFEAWVIKHGGTMGATRITIALKKCIQTFPYPLKHSSDADTLISKWNEAVEYCALEFGHGYTAIFNEFHSEGSKSDAIRQLRAAKSTMDQAVAAAYGWSDLKLDHGFNETKQGNRFTLSESARRTVLDRLLALNHQRYEEEVKAGLHEKKKNADRSSTRRRTKRVKEMLDLL